MADDAAIKKSLQYRKRLLASALEMHLPTLFSVDTNALTATLKHLQCQPESVEAAALFFGLDNIQTCKPYREVLLNLLAEAVFGKRKRGPRKGNTFAWTPAKKCLFALAHRELRRRNPKWTNERIFMTICDEIKEFKSHDPKTIRKQLPGARLELELWERQQRAERVAQDVSRLGEWLRDDPKFLEFFLSDPTFRNLVLSMMENYRSRMLSNN